MNRILILLLFLSQLIIADEFYYPYNNFQQGYLKVQRDIKANSYTITIENITKEFIGNEKEFIVENIRITEPLPSPDFFVIGNINTDAKVKVTLSSYQRKLCKHHLLATIAPFPVDKAELANTKSLEKLSKQLNKEYIYYLYGYTDTKGRDSYNKTLSEQRANYIKNFLIQKGLDSNNIITKGLGELYSTGNQDENRRVEVYPLTYQQANIAIENLYPGEIVTIRFSIQALNPSTDILQHFSTGDCYNTKISYQKLTKTQPKLTIEHQLRAFNLQNDQYIKTNWQQQVSASVCDSIDGKIIINNPGLRSAKHIYAHYDYKQALALKQIDFPIKIKQLKPNEPQTFYFTLTPSEKNNYQQSLSAFAQENLRPKAITTEISLEKPELSIKIDSKSSYYVSEIITYPITVKNTGNWPIRALKIAVTLDKNAESLTQTSWQLGILRPGEEKQVLLKAIVKDNQVKHIINHIFAQDAAYDKSCVYSEQTIEADINAIQPLSLKIIDTIDPTPLGAINEYRVRIKNINNLDMRISIQGQIDGKAWELVDKQVVIDYPYTNKNPEKVILKQKDNDNFILEQGNKTFILQLAPDQFAEFTIKTKLISLGSQPLFSLGAKLNTDINVSSFIIKTFINELVEFAEQETTILYQ